MGHDVVVVGGGIAGSALATTLAREGLAVALLERRERYDDRVRGESLWPWGVAEAQALGLHQTLLAAAGGHHVEALVDYGDGEDRAGAEAQPIPLSQLVEGAPGALNFGHPAACEALARSAREAGAELIFGATGLRVSPGPRPEVRFRQAGVEHCLACRVVVGADGRASRVRADAGIRLHQQGAGHLISGLLVEGLAIGPERDLAGIGEDVFMVAFPQGGGRARLYLCPDGRDPRRFVGPGGAERFLRSAALVGLCGAQAWSEAVPAGPCRTFPADDTWTERPFAPGVVLIGDAGGYNDPLIGQGLALALRDVRDLSERLLDDGPWGSSLFAGYGAERAERLRRMRFVAQLLAVEMTTFGVEGRELRLGIRRRVTEDPSLLAAPLAMFTGPDTLDPEVCSEPFRRRYLGIRARLLGAGS